MKLAGTLLCLLVSLISNAQMKILFIDDSDDTFLNVETIHMAIEDVGYKAHYLNSLDSFALLTSDYLSKYDLVIWQTSNDGTKLSLWNKADTDNGELKKYLDQGGKLWIGGLDFLFDKYGVAPQIFQEGEFTYDYMGLASYDFQSYGDDGGLGVPILNPEDTCIIDNLVPIRWNFPTLWWIDGVTPRPGVNVLYRMGEDSYIGKNKIASTLYSDQKFEVLSSFFDLGVAFDYEMIKASVKPILQYFDAKITSTMKPVKKQSIEVYPNPTDNTIYLNMGKSYSGNLTIIDAYGRILATKNVNDFDDDWVELPSNPGLYYLKFVSIFGEVQSIKVTKTL